MSYRKITYITLLFILLTTGCSLFRFVDNSSPEELQKFETSKDDLWNQKKALEQEKATYLKQIADQQAQIILMNRGMSEQQTRIDQTASQMAESKRLIEELNDQIRQIEREREKSLKEAVKEAEPLPPGKETPTKMIKGLKKEARKKPAAAPAAGETGAVRIKVLAGDGNIASARAMAKRITKMGYQVKRIDRAERTDFALNTIYHTPDHATTADEIMKKLGGSTIVMPLTWQSVFDLIIVTGRKP